MGFVKGIVFDPVGVYLASQVSRFARSSQLALT